MTRRIQNLSIGFTAYGLFILGMTTLISVGFLIGGAFSVEPYWFWAGLAAFVQVIGVLACAPSAIAAYGLHYRTRWARTAAIIAGGLMLGDIPIGFCLGLYALLTLSSGETAEMLTQSS